MYGWKWKYPMVEWHRLSIEHYPGWEIEDEDVPAFVKLTHTRGSGNVESHDLAVAWDDVSKAHFYQRDWTDDGIPFVNEGDIYWSGWWFQTIEERDRFLEWKDKQ